jgi:hypothetical protein
MSKNNNELKIDFDDDEDYEKETMDKHAMDVFEATPPLKDINNTNTTANNNSSTPLKDDSDTKSLLSPPTSVYRPSRSISIMGKHPRYLSIYLAMKSHITYTNIIYLILVK